MTIERAIEILDPEHREHYDSIEPVNETCRMGMNALKELSELKGKLERGVRMSEYKRLTKKDKYGHWYTDTKINDRFMWSTDGKVWERDLSHCAFDGEAIDRLAELEDKIESGLLVELPCKVGDKVYKVYGECNGSNCPYNGYFGQWRCHYKNKQRCKAFIDENNFDYSMLALIGKSIFVDKSQAEARLKELQEEKKCNQF